MSRNSKNARLIREAKQRRRAENGKEAAVSKGPNGPKQTTPKHGKKSRSKYNKADRSGPSINKPAAE